MIKRLLVTSKNIHLAQIKYAIALALIAVSLIGHAAPPTGFGTFTADAQPDTGTIASGTYKTLTQHKGKYQIIAGENSGYSGIDIIVGTNGIMIKNISNENTGKDKFTYTFKIIPEDASFINTIKIAQATYPTFNNNSNTPSGNSEIARQTLDYVSNTSFGPAAKATVLSNSSAPYYFGAMGDYFMGASSTSNNQTTFTSSNPVNNQPQLRLDSTGGVGESGLYYYDISKLKGTSSRNIYTLDRTPSPDRYVSFKSSTDKKGVLPLTPTFENILKITSTNPNNQTTYPIYSSSTIPKNSSYVSYGVNNSDSNYVIGVENAKSVTLKYEGIMNGNSGKDTDVVGETYNEWISFGVESTPNYVFSGTVFNDNGGLTLEPNKVGAANSSYFNGKFDSTSGETGISNSNLTVSLTDCSVNNNPIANTSPQLVYNTGQYNFYIPKDSLAVGQTVCLVENEPTDWEYSVDTTTNNREVTIANGKYTYDNLDFGEVTANNTALVLIKSQYVHDCNVTLNYSDSAINQTTDNPRIGFSDKLVSNVAPNQCIAYRIEAYNRGHVALNDVQITDPLQSAQSSFSNPIPEGIPTNIYDTTMPTAKVITSNKFNLAEASSSVTKATLYFNTKYGTTVDP